MTIARETLDAYVDGELTVEETARVDAALAEAPDLAAYVAQQRALRQNLHDAFDGILAAPMPAALLAATAAAPSWRWRLRTALQAGGWRRMALWSGLPATAALATGLAIGVFVRAPAGDIVPGGGGLIARGALAAALDRQLAARPERTAQARIGISFRDKTGRYCRTFTSGGTAGLACHAGGQWQIAALARTAPEAGAGAAYAPAGSAMPDAIRSAVRGLIAGAPLDASGEERARATGWNPR